MYTGTMARLLTVLKVVMELVLTFAALLAPQSRVNVLPQSDIKIQGFSRPGWRLLSPFAPAPKDEAHVLPPKHSLAQEASLKLVP